MGRIWLEETCPACNSTNWLILDDYPQDDDSSKEDVTDYICWHCKKDIRLTIADFSYKPHVVGTETGDDDSAGCFCQGFESPVMKK